MRSIVRIPERVARAAWRGVRERLRGPAFPRLERLGLHVTNSGWSSPAPDTRDLVARGVLGHQSELRGVDMRGSAQIALLQHFARAYRAEYDGLSGDRAGASDAVFRMPNGFYESVDAETLYCFLRERRPSRVIEIGSGYSTLVAAEALRKNAEEGRAAEFTAIDPYPKPWLLAGVDGVTRVLARPVQDVPLPEFEALGAGDVLVIDSSHIVKTGSDVCYEFLEILPRLRAGVAVHVHDVFLPEEYPRAWVLDRHYFWNEQYLLHAFLVGNRDWEVRWAGRFMHVRHPDLLRQSFRSYALAGNHDFFPASFWMERVA